MPKRKRVGWVVYRVRNGQPEFLGIYDNEAAAEQDRSATVSRPGEPQWTLTLVPLLRWGDGEPRLTVVDNE